MSAAAPLLQAADPAWPAQFASLAAELAPCLPARAQLEHIGSTAVPGLCAKPVLDLLLGVGALAEVDDALIAALARLGYGYRPAYEAQIPERRYFVREAGLLPRVHLHAVQRGGVIWRAQLGFRDALRDSPKLRDEYAGLKQALALQHAGDKSAYTEAKSPFIRQVLAGLRPDKPD